jgi:hypothetical protein
VDPVPDPCFSENQVALAVEPDHREVTLISYLEIMCGYGSSKNYETSFKEIFLGGGGE